MILIEVDSGTQEQSIHSGADDESRVCKGNYVGVVRHSENQCEFLVRDIRGYSGEGERLFRREAERRSGRKLNSSRSEATLA
jgi:hypothetical protein